MNTNPRNILPASVRHCCTLSIIQMYFEFIDRRHFENVCTASSIELAEGYLAEIQRYADMCTKYAHLHASVDIANRYLSAATFLVKRMKEMSHEYGHNRIHTT